jgi:radical SAM superfamily enzyme YgiQ (UPF0313 family)
MKTPEILFIYPRQFAEEPFRCWYHLGAAYIQAYLKQKGIYSIQYIQEGTQNINLLVDDILSYKAPAIGFTCYEANYYIIKLIAQKIKKKDPDVVIILGGPTPTFMDKYLLETDPNIDICVRNEGEYTVYELVKQLRANNDLSEIPGFTYRKNGKAIRNPDRPLIIGNNDELDVIPSPYLTDVLPTSEGLRQGVITSRGCPFKCTYCNFAAISRWTVRYYSIDRVIAELKKIEQDAKISKNKVIPIQDDIFTLNIARAKDICRRMIEEGIDLEMWCDTRCDRMDKELLELLYKAGFRGINFGLESAVPKVLRAVKKVTRGNEGDFSPENNFLKRIKEYVHLAKKMGFKTSVSIILGLPDETLEDGQETLRFVESLDVYKYVHNQLRIYPGTELFKTHETYHLKVENVSGLVPHLIHKTIYAYDIDQISQLENGDPPSAADRLVKIFNDDYVSNAKEYTAATVIFNNTTLVEPDVWKWLKDVLGFSSMACMINIAFCEEDRMRNYQTIVKEDIPIFFLLNLNRCLGSKGRLTPYFERKYFHDTYNYISISFSECEDYLFSMNTSMRERRKEIIALTLNSKPDIKKLLKIEENIQKTWACHLTDEWVFSNCTFCDGCRWGDKECQAVKLPRIIIDKDNVKTCFHGKPVGKVGDKWNIILKNLEKLREKEYKTRDCDSCAAKNYCSKCLFPYPMDQKEYCNIRKKHLYLGVIIQLVEITKLIFSQLETFPVKKGGGDITLRAIAKRDNKVFFNQPLNKDLSKLYVIMLSKRIFICDLDKMRIYEGTKEFSDVFELFKKAASVEELIHLVQAKYKANESDAKYLLRNFYSTLKQF